MKHFSILTIVVCLLGSAAVIVAAPVPYSDPSQVNLLRRVDASGNLVSAGVAAPGSTDPGYAHGTHRINDAGYQPWRITGHQATETWRISLPEAVDITTLDLNMRHPFYATDYTVRGSTTGFASMTDLVTVTGNTNSHPVHTIAETTVQYLEMEATGFVDGTYYISYEMEAIGTDPVYQRSGYNMFAEPGKVGTITADMGKDLMDAVGNAADLNLNTHVRGSGAPSGPTYWFVLPLAERAELMAMSMGMYEDQPWPDAQVYVSNDDAYNYVLDGGNDTWPGMTWTQVYDWAGPGSFYGDHFAFTPQDVTFIRVEWPNNAGTAALSEVEVFETYAPTGPPIPEPATLVLVGAGALGLIRRRRRT